MEWLGHADSEMVRHYYHLHDTESQRQMGRLRLIDQAGERSPGEENETDNPQEQSSRSSESTDTQAAD